MRDIPEVSSLKHSNMHTKLLKLQKLRKALAQNTSKYKVSGTERLLKHSKCKTLTAKALQGTSDMNVTVLKTVVLQTFGCKLTSLRV